MLTRMKNILRSIGLSILSIVVAGAAATAPVFAQDIGIPERKYVALGDSVAAGLGLPPGQSPTTEDAVCGRSPQAYAYQVASEAGMLLTHVACSGAKTNDLFNSQDVNGTNLTPQLEAAFAGGTPDVITLTIGANDLHWAEFVRQCYVTACGDDASTAAIKVARGYLRVKLYWAMNRIDQLSHGKPPKVFLTGYFAPYGDQVCADTQGLEPGERAWLNDQSHSLSQAIKSVTNWFDFATFVPLDFTGHELCSSDPWIQGLQDPASYHPTVGGQQAIAQAVRQAMTAARY